MSTITEPRINVKDMWKSNKATEARNEITMLRLVAKPFKMLSEYLMTMAVTRPPNTWMATVDHAHTPKLWNSVDLKDSPVLRVGSEAWEKMTGATAGSKEKRESWTF